MNLTNDLWATLRVWFLDVDESCFARRIDPHRATSRTRVGEVIVAVVLYALSGNIKHVTGLYGCLLILKVTLSWVICNRLR